MQPLAYRLSTILILLVLCFFGNAYGQNAQNIVEADYIDRWTPRNDQELSLIERRIQNAVAQVRNSVVSVRLMSGGQGSGCIITQDGVIATAGHVTRDAHRLCTITLADGTTYQGITLGVNENADYSLVRIIENVDDLPHVEMGDSETVGLGQWVFAMGHPLGLERVPFRQPPVRIGRVHHISNVEIRTDAPLIFGDSGGPLFNLDGELIGINVRISTTNATVNMHTPINLLKHNYSLLIAGGETAMTSSAKEMTYRNLITQGYQLLVEEDFDSSVNRMHEALDLLPNRPEAYYHLACVYFRHYQNTENPNEDWVLTGIEYLRASVQRGWDDIALMEADGDLNLIRNTEVYRELKIRLQRRADYRGYLGAFVRDRILINDGAHVNSVRTNSPADRAGILSGDLIHHINNVRILNSNQLITLIRSYRPGDTIDIQLSRDGEEIELAIQLEGIGEETSSLPNRYWLSGEQLRKAFSERDVSRVQESTVAIYRGEYHIAYGVIVHANGLILTKLSTLREDLEFGSLTVRYKERQYATALRATDDDRDLAILAIDAAELPVMHFSSIGVAQGSLIATVPSHGIVNNVGNVGLTHYDTSDPTTKGNLGLIVQDIEVTNENGETQLGVEVRAYDNVLGTGLANGFLLGDIIIKVADRDIQSAMHYHRLVENLRPGSMARITIRRGENTIRLDVNVGAGEIFDRWSSAHPLHRMVRGPHSARSREFGEVISHTALIKPNEVGAAIIDIRGNVVGLNIARYDRCTSFALDSGTLRLLIPALIEKAIRERMENNQHSEASID